MRRKTQSGPTCRVWGAGSGDGAGELHFPLVPRCGRCTWKQCLPWAPRGPSQEAALLAAGGPSLWPQSQEFCLLHSRRGWARLPQVTLPWTIGSWCLPRPDPLSVHTPAVPLISGSHWSRGGGPAGGCHSWFYAWSGLCQGARQLLLAWSLPLERPRTHWALLFPQLHVCCMMGSLSSFLLQSWML